MSVTEPSTRRASPRIAVDREVVVEIDGVRYQGRLVDISDHGAYVQLSIEMPVTEDLQIELPDGSARASADVRRIAEDGFGIRFDDAERARLVNEWARRR